MKSFKLVSASVLALCFASMAHAQTRLYVAGSSAFRGAFDTAVLNILDDGTDGVHPAAQVAFSGSSYTGGSGSVVHGTLKSDHSDTYVYAWWTGSAAGVIDLAQGNVLPNFLLDTTLPAVPALGNPTAFNGPVAVGTDPHKIGLAMTDASTSSVAASIATANAPQGKNYSGDVSSATYVHAGTGGAATNKTVGVVAFKWVVGNHDGVSADAFPVTNITQQQAEQLTISGSRPMSVFTNNPADAADFALFVGRNEDSGTRIIALAEAQDGFGKPAKSYQLDTGAGFVTGPAVGTVAAVRLWLGNTAVNTVPTLKWIAGGHSGYNTGGNVGNALKSVNPFTGLAVTNAPAGFVPATSKAYLLSCMGIADANGVVGAGGLELSYNGVPYSVAAVQNGTYSIWGYEHCVYLSAAGAPSTGGVPTVINGTAEGTVANQIADDLYTTSATTGGAGILFSTMAVSRSDAGAVIN